MCYCVVCSVYYYLFSFLLLFDWLSFRGRGVVFQTEPYPRERTLWDDLTWTNALPVS